VQQGELVVADFFSIDPNALVDSNQVRRRVQACAYTGSLQDRSQGCCGRAFTIGSGNQNAGKSPLRMIECPKQYAHVLKVELWRRRLRQFVAQRVDSCNGSLVGHWQGTISLPVCGLAPPSFQEKAVNAGEGAKIPAQAELERGTHWR